MNEEQKRYWRTDTRVVDGLMKLGHEIAALDGAGDTGIGGGEYEVFIKRGGIEYRVTVEAYWDEEADEPLADRLLVDVGGAELEALRPDRKRK